jgi:hypothetical protein
MMLYISHVIEEAVDVREKCIFGAKSSMSMMKMKSVVMLERFPKILSPLSHIGSLEARFRRPTVPSHDVGRKAAWEDLIGGSNLWNLEAVV